MDPYQVRLPLAFLYVPGSAPAQAVQVGLQAMITAVFVTSAVATGPYERVMALAALVGAEMAGLAGPDRDHAEAMVLAAMRGAARGTQDARLAQAAPAGHG